MTVFALAHGDLKPPGAEHVRSHQLKHPWHNRRGAVQSVLSSDVDQRLACHAGGDIGFAVALKCDGYELDQGTRHGGARRPGIDGVGHPFSAANQRSELVDELP